MSFLISRFQPKYIIRHTRPTEPIRLPQDDAAHYWAQSEWWYYVGRLTGGSGESFGFELAFFKRITSEDTAPFLSVPAHWLRDVGMVSHFAVTDLSRKRFAYKTVHNLFRDWRADPDEFHVAVNGWSAQRRGAAHLLSARMGAYRIDLRLVPAKPPVAHGERGIVGKGNGNANYYYSYTRMDVQGTLRVDGRADPVTGSAWMDHEYGTINIGKIEKGWDWFGLQLDDGSELMITLTRDTSDRLIALFGTYVDAAGNGLWLFGDDLVIVPGAFWYSRRTHARYPASWEVRVKSLDLTLTIRPLLADQELVTRPIPYWEGIVSVIGTAGRRAITGNGYVELVGYSRKTSFRKYSKWILENGNPHAAVCMNKP